MISHRISLELASQLFIGALLFIPPAQAGTQFTFIHDSFDGESLAQWTENWFTWGWQAPLNQNPLLDTTGAYPAWTTTGRCFLSPERLVR
jgi:hypothetical protein